MSLLLLLAGFGGVCYGVHFQISILSMSLRDARRQTVILVCIYLASGVCCAIGGAL